ncbi:MAG: type VI secretion system tip protein VgrG [Deltaproteobacteria bacterium]|nr:type VI secretion system tip protein VgrG [Deltaproteobacteria bacterium]
MSPEGGSGTTLNSLDSVSYAFACDEGPEADFRVYRMRFLEVLNGDFGLDLDLVTDTLDADVDQLLGASCQLDISRGDHSRSVFGIISGLDFIGRSNDYLMVNIRVVSAFTLLDQQTHSRMFQDMTVLQILDEVLGSALEEYGRTLDKGSEALGATPLDYCVQYFESDLDFAVRLMEQEGISYRFVHDEDAGHEVLTLSYDNDDFPDVSNVDGTPNMSIIADRQDTADVESLRNFDWRQELTSTAAMRRDFDFLTPTEPLEALEEGQDPKGRVRRQYHHVDRRYISDDLEARVKDRVESFTNLARTAQGTSNAIDFSPGKVFELERHTRADLEERMLLTRVVHMGECPEELLADSDGGGSGTRYKNTFKCLRVSDTPLRPRRSRLKPRTHGPETAIVSGPAGEEIHVDEHGRIKVQFHWEEERTYDETSSCWIRVRQPWGGGGWGQQFIPRVGMEVMVEFFGGDPDRPVVTGCLFNGDNGYPYPMPDSKTQSGIKTNSVAGEGSNELRFEDAGGSEEVYIHAQKDFNEVVENDHSTTVHNNQTNTVDVNQTNSVGADQTESVGGKQTMSVDKNRKVTITGSQSVSISGAEPEDGVSGSKLDITGDYKVDASNTIEVQAPTHIKFTCGGSSILIEPGKITVSAGGSAQVVLDGNALMKSAAGTKVLLDGNALTQSSGGSKVLLDGNALAQSSGGAKVFLDGNALTQSSGGSQVLLDGNALMSSPGTATVSAPTSTLAGGGGSVEAGGAGVTCAGGKVDLSGGMVNISGGMVKIN